MTGWMRKHIFGSDKAEQAARDASQAALGGQQQALDYLQETEAVPIGIRDEALQDLSGFYQTPGQAKSQEELIQEAKASPLYGALTGAEDLGIEAIMRQAGATGKLRSGDVRSDIFDYTTQLRNKALLDSFNQSQQRQDYERELNLRGLEGLAGVEGNQNMIARLMASMGETEAQGITGAAQARAAGTQNALNAVPGAVNALLGIGKSAAAMFSDIRLKRNIQYIGDRDGFRWYRWEWNELAQSLGLEGESVGVMAHEIHDQYPNAVYERDGFLAVDYNELEQREAA